MQTELLVVQKNKKKQQKVIPTFPLNLSA